MWGKSKTEREKWTNYSGKTVALNSKWYNITWKQKPLLTILADWMNQIGLNYSS